MTLRGRLVVALALLCLVSRPATAQLLRTVALTREAAPGTPDGLRFLRLGYPVLNSAGQTAFEGTVYGIGVSFSNEEGVWSEGTGSLMLIARAGDPVPGDTNGFTFRGFFGAPALNSAGKTAFFSTIWNGIATPTFSSIFSDRTGALSLVVKDRDLAPGTPAGVHFDDVGTPYFSSTGMIGFGAYVAGSGITDSNNEGFWSDRTGSFQLIARESGPAPGVPGAMFVHPEVTSSALRSRVLTAGGQISFASRITGGGVVSQNDLGIWSDVTGSLSLVVREGQPAPGTPSGITFGGLNDPASNSLGQIAFRAGIRGSGVSNSNNLGIWSNGFGELTLVARRGSPAPGTPDGVIFGTLSAPDVFTFDDPAINDVGNVAFHAQLAGTGVNALNNSAIWSDGFGTLSLIARAGDHAPGTPVGDKFFDFSPPAINNFGQVAFGANVNSVWGIWAQDRAGNLRLVARPGDALEVAPGDFRIVSELQFLAGIGTGDGRSYGFNDLGELAFQATFNDGSQGVFVSYIATVPEPTAFYFLAATGLLGLLSRRFR